MPGPRGRAFVNPMVSLVKGTHLASIMDAARFSFFGYGLELRVFRA